MGSAIFHCGVHPFLPYQTTMGFRSLVSRGNDATYELARRGALLVPSAVPCSCFPLMSRIHSCLFSHWWLTSSFRFFDIQAPLISTEELVFSGHACSALSCLSCNGHSLLLSSYLSKIGRIENSSCSLRTSVLENLSSHSALSSYGFCVPLALWRIFFSLRSLVQVLGSFPASGAPQSSAMPTFLGRGRVTTTKAKTKSAHENVK